MHCAMSLHDDAALERLRWTCASCMLSGEIGSSHTLSSLHNQMKQKHLCVEEGGWVGGGNGGGVGGHFVSSDTRF